MKNPLWSVTCTGLNPHTEQPMRIEWLAVATDEGDAIKTVKGEFQDLRDWPTPLKWVAVETGVHSVVRDAYQGDGKIRSQLVVLRT